MNYIWFNANFNANGVTDGTTISVGNSIIQITASNGTVYTVAVPDATITFSASATCSTTTFSGGQWVTTVPLSGSDEIFLTGRLIKVSDITGSNSVDLKASKVTWSNSLSTNTSGVTVKWKWGAAIYRNDPEVIAAAANPNLIGVKPTHTNACGYPGSEHAGTPMNIRTHVVGGGRGGGGSNFTGSWSATGACAPCVCMPPGATDELRSRVDSGMVLPETNVCPAAGRGLRALVLTYEGRNSNGHGTVTGNPNGLDTAYIVTTGATSDLFTGLVTFNGKKDPDSAYFVIDAGAGGTLPNQVTVEIHKGQSRSAPIVSTVTFDTSCDQPINLGDYFGSFCVSGGSQ